MIAFWSPFLGLFQTILIVGVILWIYCLIDILKKRIQ